MTRQHPFIFPSAILLAGALGIAACGSSSSSSNPPDTVASGTEAPAGEPSAGDVTIDGFAFTPPSLTVAVGDTVTWTNEQDVDHTVTADDASWTSGNLARSATFAQTFDTAGTFAYHCAIHPTMTATVIAEG